MQHDLRPGGVIGVQAGVKAVLGSCYRGRGRVGVVIGERVGVSGSC